jgi:hypothetical protein
MMVHQLVLVLTSPSQVARGEAVGVDAFKVARADK